MPTETRYENFDLRIWREGDRYLAEVTNSPAGSSEREVLQWPFGGPADRVLLLELENAVLKSRLTLRGGPIISPEEKVLRDFGAEVFKAVFRDSRSVSATYTGSRALLLGKDDTGLRLNLRIDPPELACLPWEYVFDEAGKPDHYLCLSSKSPLVRYLHSTQQRAPVRGQGPVRVLGMIANPGGTWTWLDTEAERRHMEEILRAPGLQVEFNWVLRATPDGLFDMMQRGPWHIFHFIGHGGTDRYTDADGQTRSEGFVVMDDGLGGPVKVSASRLADILADGDVDLAVLNCCESAQGNASSSVGAALVEQGVPMAIAMQFAITNTAASRFSEHFYKSLTKGQTVERALTVARKYIRMNSDAEWAIPVLFTRSGSFALFDAMPDAPMPQEALGALGTVGTVGAARAVPAAAPPARMSLAQSKLRELWGDR